jgi:hypothetical protein
LANAKSWEKLKQPTNGEKDKKRRRQMKDGRVIKGHTSRESAQLVHTIRPQKHVRPALLLLVT